MSTDALLVHLLMYVLVPVWLAAGFADYLCHRSAALERTSGAKESLLHLVQFAEVGVPLMAVLFLEVTAAVLLLMVVALVLHQATAIWDVRYANDTRRVSSAEQHVHGVLEMVPFIAVAMMAVVHRDQLGEPNFAIMLKRDPLPSWYLCGAVAGAAILGILPYGEELLRSVRAARHKRG
ncbi:MAG TPA: diguanylate cyclase [Reyranella sp.]|nr:diguanylate cyclase [Reyranella sp.]